MAKRRKFTDQFKAKVPLEALRGDKTIQEIAAKHQVLPNQVSTWKRQPVEGMAEVFARVVSQTFVRSEIRLRLAALILRVRRTA